MNRLIETFQRRPDRAALVIAAALAALGGVLLWDSGHVSGAGGYSGVGPDAMPRLVGTALLLLAVWTALAAFRRDFPARPRQEPGPVLWIVAGLALQILLLKPAGFSIATGLLFAFTARAFGKRNLALTVPLGIVLSFAVWVVFSQVLMLGLSPGLVEHIFFPGAK